MVNAKSPMHTLQAIETAPDRMIMIPLLRGDSLQGNDLKAADLGRQARDGYGADGRAPRGRRANAFMLSKESSGSLSVSLLRRDLHIFKVPGLVVDADTGRCDPACEFAGLNHEVHLPIPERQIVSR